MKNDSPNIGITKQLFQSYYDEYRDALVNFSAKFIKDRNLAEDIVQENLASYLYRSTRNRTINAIKRNSQQVFEHALALSDEHLVKETLSDRMTENELKGILHTAIMELPPRRRVIFKMKVFQRYSNDEIGAKLNISIATVKSQFTKALAYVRSSLEPHL